MPEYLAPGVYVEETSFRAKSIEGVSTSTAGFVGPTRSGPVGGAPELLTSVADFRRIYGDSLPLVFDGAEVVNDVAHAVEAFFAEGGRRLYVQRVYVPPPAPAEDHPDNDILGHARAWIDFTAEDVDPGADNSARIVARFPGAAGNMRVTFEGRIGANALIITPTDRRLTRIREFDVVWGGTDATTVFRGDGLFVVRRNAAGEFFLAGNGEDVTLTEATLRVVRPVTLVVSVERRIVNSQGLPAWGPDEVLGEFGIDARSAMSALTTLSADPPTRYQDLTVPIAIRPGNLPPDADEATLASARRILGAAAITALVAANATAQDRRLVVTLAEGADGDLPGVDEYAGDPDANTGLGAFQSVEDISIVAAPGYSRGFGEGAAADRVAGIHNALITHCETMRYRIAVLDSPPAFTVTQALDFRNRRSSTHAALYYPWVTVVNPVDGSRLQLPPSGFVAGIYARNDIEHAVFKAPANEVVRTAIDFETRLNKAQQEVLNPEGVNCFRFLEGRGFVLWGARTISDDPEWKYVSLRRYFAYLEHSIDNSTQWAVFENNGPRLWDNVRRMVEDFLYNEWRMGGLMGTDPKEAYFVRCDLSTMTQNDLDNGRLVCLIGVAPVRPAEFVIFRIGQWTANANR